MIKYELFGFAGKKGSGKNYIAQELFLPFLVTKPTLIMAFADHFKVDTIINYSLLNEDVFGDNKSEVVRKLLQQAGHEQGRLKRGEDIWIRILNEWMLAYHHRGIQRFIITDVRYENEIEWIKEQGGYVFYITKDKLSKDEHISENSITGSALSLIDYIIDNNNYSKTLGYIDNIIKELKI